MTTADRIYQRYVSGLMHIGQATDAVRLALRLALDDALENTQPTQVDQRVAEHNAAQIAMLNEWLAERAPDYYTAPTDTATATIALLDDMRAGLGNRDIEMAGMRNQIAVLDGDVLKLNWEINNLRHQYKPERFADLANWMTRAGLLDGESGVIETAITALQSQQAKISRLTEELTTLRELAAYPPPARLPTNTNGAGLRTDVAAPTAAAAVEPTPSAQNEDVSTGWMERFQARFADDQPMLDWLDGIAAGRNLFRNLPRDARWKLVQAVINDIRPRNGQSLTQSAFDAAKPEWMSSAAAASITFGGGKWDHVVLVAVQA